MQKTAKDRAYEIFVDNIHIAGIDQTIFRRKVMDTLKEEYNATTAAAATHYNNAKKLAESNGLISGLGRPQQAKRTTSKDVVSDSECYTVLEIVDDTVTRTRSFLDVTLAKANLKLRLSARNPSCWKLISGMGPNVGDTYRLRPGEVEID